jgi:hypothetical protein
VALAACAAPVAGCGGGSKKISKAEFVKRADAICTRANAKDAAAARARFDNRRPTRAQVTSFGTSVLIPSIQRQLNGIDALPKPKTDEGELKDLLASARRAIGKVKADPTLLVSTSSPFVDTNRKAQAFGLHVCGRGG